MTSRLAKLQQDTSFRLMRLLHANTHMSQLHMGKALGIRFCRNNYFLNALIEKDLVQIQNFSPNQNKFGYAYLITLTVISEKAVLICSSFKRKLQENETLKAEIKALKLAI